MLTLTSLMLLLLFSMSILPYYPVAVSQNSVMNSIPSNISILRNVYYAAKIINFVYQPNIIPKINKSLTKVSPLH